MTDGVVLARLKTRAPTAPRERMSREPGAGGASTAIAIDPTPARVNACAPRSSVSSARRAAVTSDDHRSTIAGFPLSAASERVVPARSGSEKSGAGKGSYIQVVRGADAGARTEVVIFAADRGLNASVWI